MGHMRLYILVSVLVSLSHQEKEYPLPLESIPHHYKISLTPNINPDDRTFEGESEIQLEVLESTKNLTLHALELVIVGKTILITNETIIEAEKHIIDVEQEFLILVFRQNINPGNYTLRLHYTGILHENKKGFFIDYYKSEKKERVYFVSLFFEETQARQAFPCWDEPELKATFDISIRHFANYSALSNMPIKRQINETSIDGKILTEFETTPLMSTYIVSFIVCDVVHIGNSQGNFSIWARKNSIDSMKFGYDVGLKALSILEEYTNISYGFPKLDIVGIPYSMEEGMRNWGLIIIRDSDIILKENSSTHEQFKVIQNVAHEIAHQWFGNLFTPAPWQDISLTEELTDYFKTFLAAKVMNQSRIMELFYVHNEFALSPREWFNDISSPQGDGTKIRMLNSFLSEDVFHNGIKKFLEAYKYKEISTEDFWESMQDALNESSLPHKNFNVKQVMESYIYESGSPIVNVTRDYKTGTITISHKCSSCRNSGSFKKNRRQKWWIPINFATSSSLNFSSTLPTHWLKPRDKELIIEGVDPNDWIIVNIQKSGYYRVNYDITNWKRIINYLNTDKFSNIHVLNRAQIILDVIEFDREKMIEPSILTDLIPYMRREVDYVPWVAAFNLIFAQIIPTKYAIATAVHAKALMSALIEDEGSEEMKGDDFFTILKREVAINAIRNWSPAFYYPEKF